MAVYQLSILAIRQTFNWHVILVTALSIAPAVSPSERPLSWEQRDTVRPKIARAHPHPAGS
jgi:hypothetical protein